MLLTISILATLSLTLNVTLVWYVRKLLSLQEDMSAELSEEIYVFQEHLESILQSDAFMGEPTLEKLLDDIRGFGQSTENIRLRLIPEKTNNIEETPENN